MKKVQSSQVIVVIYENDRWEITHLQKSEHEIEFKEILMF